MTEDKPGPVFRLSVRRRETSFIHLTTPMTCQSTARDPVVPKAEDFCCQEVCSYIQINPTMLQNIVMPFYKNNKLPAGSSKLGHVCLKVIGDLLIEIALC